MKVLILNSSPKAGRGCTGIMVAALKAGMASAGAEVEVLELARLKVKPCLGCLQCWLKTSGHCVHGDDMPMILERMAAADAEVWASPLYHYHLNGIMKNVIDRTLPQEVPWMVEDHRNPGHSCHPFRSPKPEGHPARLALLSVCGFPELNQFDYLVQWFRFVANQGDRENWGEILRPAAELLHAEGLKTVVERYLRVVERAGREMVVDGKVSSATAEELTVDLMPGGAARYRARVNAHFAELLGEEAPAG